MTTFCLIKIPVNYYIPFLSINGELHSVTFPKHASMIAIFADESMFSCTSLTQSHEYNKRFIASPLILSPINMVSLCFMYSFTLSITFSGAVFPNSSLSILSI